MAESDQARIVRAIFEAYRTKDREAAEALLAGDFTFTSPYDDAIDRAAYFERCWPNSDRIREHVIERIFVDGDEAFVTYKAIANDGREFRNTEFFTLAGGRIRSVDVYFGATYKDGRFIPQK
jgi:ketosteroid isomerase-like protein